MAQSNVATAVMYAPFMAGDVTRRQLTADAAAAVAHLYPKPGADPGTCPLTDPDASCAGTPPPRPGTVTDGGVPPWADAGRPADGGSAGRRVAVGGRAEVGRRVASGLLLALLGLRCRRNRG